MQTTADRMDERTVLAEVSAVEVGDRHKKCLPLFSFTCPSNLESLQEIRLEFYIFFYLNGNILGPVLEMHFTPLILFLVSLVLTLANNI